MEKLTQVFIGFSAVLVIGVGCASMKLVNTSPVMSVPSTPDFQRIHAVVLVATKDNTKATVATALSAADVFSQVRTRGSGNETGDLTLHVASSSKSNTHFGFELACGILRLLLLEAADDAFADKYDYSVELTARLMKADQVVGEYRTSGSYHSECPESAGESVKRYYVQAAVRRSWDHALAILVGQIKQDRQKIVGALGE